MIFKKDSFTKSKFILAFVIMMLLGVGIILSKQRKVNMWFRRQKGINLRTKQSDFGREMGRSFSPPWCDGQQGGYGRKIHGPGWWKNFNNQSLGSSGRGMGRSFSPPWCDGQQGGYGRKAHGPGWWKNI